MRRLSVITIVRHPRVGTTGATFGPLYPRPTTPTVRMPPTLIRPFGIGSTLTELASDWGSTPIGHPHYFKPVPAIGCAAREYAGTLVESKLRRKHRRRLSCDEACSQSYLIFVVKQTTKTVKQRKNRNICCVFIVLCYCLCI